MNSFEIKESIAEASPPPTATNAMRAAVYTRYGLPEIVEIKNVEKPVPNEHEVLIKVRAAAVNPADWRLLGGVPFIFKILFRVPKLTATRPGRLGHDVAGQVEAVGGCVTGLKPGDEVFGTCSGAFAEYACAPELKLAVKSDRFPFEQAASVPVAGLTALQGLRDKGQIRPGQKVLINGAAGGVGTFAVQIAKSFGADVTGVCSSRNVAMVRSIGADRVIDYTHEDFTKGWQRYDLILDCVGNHSLSDCRRALNSSGVCVIVGAPKKPGLFLTRFLTAPVLSWFVGQKFMLFIAKINKEDLTTMRELIESGKVKPVIDKTYTLSEASVAIKYLENGHARGKVVITLG